MPVILIVSFLICLPAGPVVADRLADEFASPPGSARPWVYWFWKNGNISRQGITADLEAMHRVGIGGVILMEVALGSPQGPVAFFSPAWRELFRHAVAEADRLGIEISVNSAPGWTGSGGPWVKPEQSMQKVVAGETRVTGPRRFDEKLPQPETLGGFYRDIAALAFPTPQGDYRIADLPEKALYQRGPYSSAPGVRPAFAVPAEYPSVPASGRIEAATIVDLSAKMDAAGRLVWDVPAGSWTIVRFGRTSTGQTNRPAPSPGLECDKLDKAALDAHFREFTAKLLADAGPRAGKTLVATHLDSWEVGGQNWTAGFREEFQKRRGYDPLPYLPVMSGRVVESLDVSERFLWDLRQTVSEMLVENHGRHLRELARRHGLWLSIEPYDMTPCDDMTLGAAADVPMCEFWSNTFDTRYSVKEATSIGHVYGKPVIAAEAFTSTESWLYHPATVKALGDWAFSEGVNRFVIHRYVHQPFPQVRPGLSLGPHGLHYERTQTWWELTGPWHRYLARCQHLLQQGLPAADVLYLSPEGAPNVFQPPKHPPAGCKFDACTPEALLTRVSVKDGRLVLPHGASYRLLVLPESPAMTPALAAKIKRLVEDGATVIGAAPEKSPSLAGYPQCDAEVRKLAEALWGPAGAAGAAAADGERSVGKGRIICARAAPVSDELADVDRAVAEAQWTWGGEGNPAASAPVGKRYFRRVLAIDKQAEIQSAHVLMTADNAFELWVNGRAAGSGENFHQLFAFDVTALLRPGANVLAVAADNSSDQPNPAGLVGAVAVRYRRGNSLVVLTDRQWQTATEAGRDWTTDAAAAGWSQARQLGPLGMSPWGTPSRTKDHSIYPASDRVVAVLRRMGWQPDFVADRPLRFAHRRIGPTDAYFVANGDDQAVEAVCTFRVAGKRSELWHPESGQVRLLPQFSATGDGRTTVPLRFEPQESFFVVFRSDASVTVPAAPRGENFPQLGSRGEISGPWTVTFDRAWGGPAAPVVFDRLADWTKRPEDGIRHYSGAATYSKTFQLSSDLAADRRVYLDLGRVEVMAEVKLNGKNLGVVWKRPFRIEITGAARPGENRLEVKVVNLWPNRMIGDERLPPDCEVGAGRTLARWPQWLLEGKPSPTGRYTFSAWRQWTGHSPLLESGLLGPVTIVAAGR